VRVSCGETPPKRRNQLAPLVIKPDTYDVKAALPETIKVRIIRYRKLKSGIEVEFE
jgi:hypothetical protein